MAFKRGQRGNLFPSAERSHFEAKPQLAAKQTEEYEKHIGHNPARD